MKKIPHFIVILVNASLLAILFTLNLFAVGSGVSVSSSQINFGKQTVGVASAPTSITISNTSREQVVIRGVSLSSQQFTYSGPSLPATLNPGQGFTGNVTFTPTAASSYEATLGFERRSGSTISVALSGSGANSSTQTVPPSITTQPASQTITSGNTATFSVAAAGTAPMSYQWRSNGSNISGASSSSYTTATEATASSGSQFSVVVSNSAGNVTSSGAVLTVNAAPVGALNSSSSSLSFGNVNVTNNESLGVTLTNAGSSSISISNVSVAGAGFDPSGVSSGQIIPGGGTATLSVAFDPAAGGTVNGNVTITSNASDPSLVINLSGTGVQGAVPVNLTWTASTSAVAGYNVFRSTISAGSYSQLNASLVNGTQYTDSTALGGQTYYYVVTAVSASNVQSPDSNQASAITP
jgi:hypothetical protein